MKEIAAPDDAVRSDAAAADRVQQAGAVVFRLTSGAPEILLVRAKKDPSQWIFPKGHIEPRETAVEAALREAREEAGVDGRALGEIGALDFTSGKEPVRARYFLLHATEERTAEEPREKKWFSLSEAARELTHSDARRLLMDAFPDIEDVLIAQGAAAAKDPPFQELLLAEYEHLADSFLRNEEDGEKRAAFFISLAGATGAALAFLLDDKNELTPGATNPLVVIALFFLLALGYLTFLRVVRRNVASDGYKRSLNRVRRAFVPTPKDPRRIFLAFDPFTRARRAAPSWKSFGGGWLETVALIESLIAGAFVAALIPTPHWICDGGVAVLAALATWALLLWDASRRYDRA